MQFLALICIVSMVWPTQIKDRPPLKLKPGDRISVTTPYGGEFVIMDDGAVYGRGFGRLVLEGKTWSEGQAEIRRVLKKFVKPEDVFLTVTQARPEHVYLVGLGGGKGPVELTPALTMRQLLSGVTVDENPDLIEVQVFRNGVSVGRENLEDLLKGAKDIPLQADDVVSLSPASFVRIWVTGRVANPGQLKLPTGTDAYQAVAAAGGVRQDPEQLDEETTIVLRRGPEIIELPARNSGVKPPPLEAGDTLTVVTAEARRVTVLGEVTTPGEIVLRGARSLLAAIAAAEGVTPNGSLTSVLVMRKGEMIRVDASAPAGGGKPAAFDLETGDLVYVQRNERAIHVFGEVAKAGKVLMEDRKEYRLSDALALAGGLTDKGTLRRVYLARPGMDGKVVIQQFNLDEYLKDGKVASNPMLQPGDSVLFGQPKGLNLSVVSQLVSTGLLFQSVLGGK